MKSFADTLLYRHFLLLLCVCALFSCGSALTGGTGSGGEAMVIGKVVNIDGTPESNARVMLMPYDFDPVTDKMSGAKVLDTTDNRGEYRLAVSQPSAAQYTLQAISATEQTRSLITGISVTAGNGQVLVQPPAVLQKTGAIKVKLPAGTTATNGYFFIPGTTIYSLLSDSNGDVMLDSVPAGVNLSVEYAVRGSSTLPQLVRDSVIVAPGGNTTIAYVGWMHSKQIFLNTTSSGAGVAGSVTGFPALVRLTSSNFTFTEAKQDGADLRFAKSDGTLLPYEIERWDYLFSLAEIWVKIDTVYGNNNSQNIIMYWGNPGAISTSNGAAVFDTATGLQGVWHLNDPVSGHVKDATSNGYNGTPVNVTAQSAVNAMVGVGRRLQGNDSGYIVLQGTADSKLNFRENGIYAISAWVYIDTLDGAVHNIVSKCDQQYNLEDYANDWEFAEYKSTQQWEMTRSPATAKTWTHVVGVRNQAKQYLFVNGLCVDSTIDIPVPTSSARNTSYPVMFGKSDGNQSSPGMPFLFHGILDEIRMLNRAPSVDWIKLCYMNQKQQDKLIEFK